MSNALRLNTAFKKAARYRIPKGAVLKNIGSGAFDILDAQSEENILVTEFTYVCAGLALASVEKKRIVALMHIFSTPEHYAAGPDGVIEHTRKSWRVFNDALQSRGQSQGDFRAVTFGGLKFDGKNAPKPPEAETAEFFTMRHEEKAIRNSDDFINADRTARADMLKKYTAYFAATERKRLENTLGKNVSELINDTLFDCVRKSGFICRLRDLRYQDVPHDAVVERDSGRIIVGRHRTDKIFDKVNVPVVGGARLPVLNVI